LVIRRCVMPVDASLVACVRPGNAAEITINARRIFAQNVCFPHCITATILPELEE